MAVQYYNGQLYDVWKNPSGMLNFPGGFLQAKAMSSSGLEGYNKVPGLGWALPIGTSNTSTNTNQSNLNGMYSDPFGTAMSGTKSGTLQPYVNRMTQNASNALYGGLLGYSPQSMVAGDAGGTPVNSTAPQFNIPSALSQYGNGLNFTGFGNRSWMGK